MNCKLLAEMTNKFPTETGSSPYLDNQLSPATEPASIPTLDGWIESLMNCKLLAEMTKQSPVETGSNSPFDNALVRRASILDYQKPSASRLRNEIHRSPVDDAQKASEFVKTKDITLSTSPKCHIGGERGILPLLTRSEEEQ